MYVAFRWLITLAITKWLALCCLNIYLTEYKTANFLSTTIVSQEFFKFNNNASTLKDIITENKTKKKWNDVKNYKRPRIYTLHYVILLASATAVLIYHKIMWFTVFSRANMDKLIKFLERNIALISDNLKLTIKYFGVAILHYSNILWELLRKYVTKAAERLENGQNTNISSLKRLNDLVHDRKALGQLLIAAIDENKDIRRKYQMEVITKNRLLRYVHDTRRVMKENKTRYVDFRQLYLLTEKENCMLKNDIRFLREKKDEAEKKFLELINVVFRSKSNDLKAYCTRFIVDTERNLLNSDVNAEIQKFMQNSRKPVITLADDRVDNILFSSSRPAARVTEIIDDDRNELSSVSNGPKLRGLPGEYVWTVKDKNGIIEKIYEYNYETDHDNGDIIRRIRQYSVYHDNDCFLDHMNLATIRPTCPSLSASATRIRLDIKSISSQGFLTKVLMKNSSLRSPSIEETLPPPYTTCDF